jgi:hypothetical protein
MDGETFWTWTTRVCAVGTLVYLMAAVGFEKTPTWAFILLIGLFFGPDALKGQINILGAKKNGNGK